MSDELATEVARADRQPASDHGPRAAQRRRRQDARRRVLDTARGLLEERPWHAITLEEIMSGAQLTRTTFYRYFEHRESLLIALLEDLGVELDAAGDSWKRGAADPVGELTANLAALVQTFVDHGRLLQALSDAAVQDSDLRRAYLELAERLIVTTERRIAADVAAGVSAVRDPREVAAALVWCNERYLLDAFGRHPLGDPEAAADALAEIWVATVYGRR